MPVRTGDIMDYNHYKKMIDYTGKTLEYAGKNDYIPILLGAAPDLRDISLQKLFLCSQGVFIDVDATVLDSIAHILIPFKKNYTYCNKDITGAINEMQKKITRIYLSGLSSHETINLVTELFNRYEFPKEVLKRREVLLSLNVISELQPPVRAFVEKMHRFVFGESIEDSVDSRTLSTFKRSNKALYNKFINFHLHMSDNYVCSNYFMSAYENGQSYLDAFCRCPNDAETIDFICSSLDRSLCFNFWDWSISADRKIRMCQFCIER